MQPFTSLPVQTRDATTISRDRAVNRSFFEKQCLQGQFHVSIYFVINKETIFCQILLLNDYCL